MKSAVDQSDIELDLITRASKGDENAFRRLVELHESAVASVVIGMIGPGDDADDVGQETFVRFLGSLPRFRGDSSVRTYLTRIAMNLSIDVLKRRKRTLGWIRFGESKTDANIAAPDETRTIEQDDTRARVRRAVDRLDVNGRSVVVLRILEERSTREAAEILGVPEGTVMSRLKRAMEKLEVELRPLMKE